MNKSIWEWLEIEPTGEISEIRAAYARQVKKYHPEDTPEEFEQLQKAYKSALRQARAAKRMETVPQSVQESQKSGSGFEKRDMPGFFENAGMTEEPNVPSWENTGSMSGVTSEPGTTPDLEIAGTPDEVESEIESDSEYDFAEVGKDEPEQQCLKEIETRRKHGIYFLTGNGIDNCLNSRNSAKKCRTESAGCGGCKEKHCFLLNSSLKQKAMSN